MIHGCRGPWAALHWQLSGIPEGCRARNLSEIPREIWKHFPNKFLWEEMDCHLGCWQYPRGEHPMLTLRIGWGAMILSFSYLKDWMFDYPWENCCWEIRKCFVEWYWTRCTRSVWMPASQRDNALSLINLKLCFLPGEPCSKVNCKFDGQDSHSCDVA